MSLEPRSPRSRSRSRSRSSSPSHSRYRAEREQDQADAEKGEICLFIASVSLKTKDEELEKRFSKYGKVLKCAVVKDPRSEESRGFAFVTMSSNEEADAAIKGLNRTEVDGRIITVEKSRRGRPRTPTPGRFMGDVKKNSKLRREGEAPNPGRGIFPVPPTHGFPALMVANRGMHPLAAPMGYPPLGYPGHLPVTSMGLLPRPYFSSEPKRDVEARFRGNSSRGESKFSTRSSDRDREREREREKDKDREKDREREKEREKDRDHEREREKPREIDKELDKEKEPERGARKDDEREKNKAREPEKDNGKSKEQEKGNKDREQERGREREREGEKDRDASDRRVEKVREGSRREGEGILGKRPSDRRLSPSKNSRYRRSPSPRANSHLLPHPHSMENPLAPGLPLLLPHYMGMPGMAGMPGMPGMPGMQPFPMPYPPMHPYSLASSQSRGRRSERSPSPSRRYPLAPPLRRYGRSPSPRERAGAGSRGYSRSPSPPARFSRFSDRPSPYGNGRSKFSPPFDRRK